MMCKEIKLTSAVSHKKIFYLFEVSIAGKPAVYGCKVIEL